MLAIKILPILQVSVDTMAITALPLSYWLKERLKSWVQLSGHEGLLYHLLIFIKIFKKIKK